MKKIKLVIAIAAAVILSAGIACAIPQTVSAAGDVKINEKNFPDSVFRDYVKENFDKNKDGKLSSSEVKNATSVNVMGVSITSLKGIEYLTELTELLCSHSSLTTLVNIRTAIWAWEFLQASICTCTFNSVDAKSFHQVGRWATPTAPYITYLAEAFDTKVALQ